MIYIGIDTGVHTGFAVWDSIEQRFREVDTLPIHRAMERVLAWVQTGAPVEVIFEDARLRRWFGRDKGVSQLQGAGSIKRDAGIWEAFLKDKGIAFTALPPAKGLTKWDAGYFAAVTGWSERCSEHARDAALLVYQRTPSIAPACKIGRRVTSKKSTR